MMVLKVDDRARGLIFDIDGTLADTLPAHLQAWQEVAAEYQFEFTEAFFYRIVGMSSENIVHLINQQQKKRLDPMTIVDAKNAAYLKLNSGVGLVAPVFQLVKDYHGKLPMSLGTGEYRDVALVNVKVTGLDRYFDILVTADDVKISKPDPETFLKCAELMGIPPEQCQVFEDGEAGLEAGRKAGMIITDVKPYLRKGLSA